MPILQLEGRLKKKKMENDNLNFFLVITIRRKRRAKKGSNKTKNECSKGT